MKIVIPHTHTFTQPHAHTITYTTHLQNYIRHYSKIIGCVGEGVCVRVCVCVMTIFISSLVVNCVNKRALLFITFVPKLLFM